MEENELENRFLDMLEDNRQVIYKVCYLYSSSDYQLNDLYQEIVICLWKSYRSFRGDSKISTWIYRVALNTAISFIRKSKSRVSVVPISIERDDLFVADDSQSDNLRQMYALINRLGKLERALIMLWLEEKSYQEISEIIGISATNVGVRLSRIKEKLVKMSNE